MNLGEGHKNLKQALVHELKKFWLYTAFLSFFMCAFTIYRSLLLAEYSLVYFHFGFNILEAMILAKIILLGQHLKLGDKRFCKGPMIFPTLYKSLLFGILVVVLTSIEFIIHGMMRGETLIAIYDEFINRSIYEYLARGLVMFFFFIIFFAFLEVDAALGEGKLFTFFFRGGNQIDWLPSDPDPKS